MKIQIYLTNCFRCNDCFARGISLKLQMQEREPALCGLKRKRSKIQWTIQDVFTATVVVTVRCTNNAGNANGRNHAERCGANSISVHGFGILEGCSTTDNGNQLLGLASHTRAASNYTFQFK